MSRRTSSIQIEGWYDDTVVCRTRLPHGVDPGALLRAHGWQVDGHPQAETIDDRIEVRLPVQPADAIALPPPRPPVERAVPAASERAPVLLQRVGAYALVSSSRGVLATEHSARTSRPGTWGLPGGGVERGEQPVDAAVRECWEETGQFVQDVSLVMVQTAHWIGRAPSGRLEDFHAVRLIHTAACPDPTDPVVHDRDGTTAAAAWFPLAELSRVNWAIPAREQLQRLGLLPGA